MKTRRILISIFCFALLGIVSANAQNKATKEFEGSVVYSLSINGIPNSEEVLATIPDFMKNVSIKARDGKVAFNVMNVTTIYYNKETNETINKLDLSMMGLGSFCIPIPTETTDNFEPKLDYSKEKDILGHKAVSVYINDSISYWVATDLLLSFPLNSNSNIFLPLEFDIENNGINLHLIATSISFDKPSKNEVEIPKDCNTITMEELQELLFEIQGGMLDDDDIDLDLEEDE
ncbi:MAG: hypothetical protein IKY22_07180 [Bacteroidales bacterium]|nr:hypothetical protein [Bacteroidales bacterium]